MISPTTEETLAPSVVKPMVIHILDFDEKGNVLDETLCGHLWDRLLPTQPGVTCSDCQEIFFETYGITWASHLANYGIM